MHRGDLQRELISAARARPEMSFRLGAKVEDFVTHVRGVTVQVRVQPDWPKKTVSPWLALMAHSLPCVSAPLR